MLQSCTRRLVTSCVPPTCSAFAATTAPTTSTTIRNRTRCLATTTAAASARLYSDVHHGRSRARTGIASITTTSSSSIRTSKMATLSAFLAQARERLRSVTHGQDKVQGGDGGGNDGGGEGTVTFVVGNESAGKSFAYFPFCLSC